MCLQTLETRPVYTEEELQRFEVELLDREEELKRKAENLRQQQELLKERGKALEAQRKEYQQVMRSRRGHAPFSAHKGDKSIVLFLLFFYLCLRRCWKCPTGRRSSRQPTGSLPRVLTGNCSSNQRHKKWKTKVEDLSERECCL